MQKLLTVQEFATILRVKPRSVYRIAKNLPLGIVAKVGGSLRFDQGRLDAWLANGGQLTPST